MIDTVPASAPADETLTSEDGNNNESVEITFPFREAVGSLMYLAVATIPDIAFAVSNVSRHLEKPQRIHVTAVKRIMKYINQGH